MPNDSCDAQKAILLRYAGAVHEYLMKVTRDEHTANDLSQEFAYRFLRGDFRNVVPEKGRFRDFLKKSLNNLVNDWHRRRQAQVRMLQSKMSGTDNAHSGSGVETSFDRIWRKEIIRRTWEALDATDNASQLYLAQVLKFRAQNPDLTSAETARQLSDQLDRKMTAESVRQILVRARKLFGELLKIEISQLIDSHDPAEIADELQDLQLLKYCE